MPALSPALAIIGPFICLAIAVVVLLRFVSVFTQRKPPPDALEQANRAVNAGQLKRAIVILQDALIDQPQRGDLALRLSQLESKLRAQQSARR